MSRDPYRYFRIEARELLDGLGQGVLELERGQAGRETVARLLRLAHTLKGAARVVKQVAVAELAHSIEGVLAPHRDGSAPARERIDELLRSCDAISAALKSLDAPEIKEGEAAASPSSSPSPSLSPSPSADEPLGTVRIEIGEMDALLGGVGEVAVQLTALKQQLSRLGLERTVQGGVEQVERELLQVRDAADRMRLVPAQVLFGTLERAARDAAQSVGVTVELRTSGGDNRVDAHVLSKLGEALVQLVRNAVAHGVESTAKRAAARKPPAGVIEISVERRGGRMAFVCRDDGRGIDVEAVRSVAVKRRLVSSSEAGALDLGGVVQLLLRGGLSTTPVATLTSGRGVGLDLVRNVVAELKGEVIVGSTPGQGTTVELGVPVSLSSVTALQLEAGGNTVSIPLAAVPRVLGVSAAEIVRSGARESMMFEGRAIPFLPITRALQLPAPGAQKRSWCVVVVRSDEMLTGVGVDRLLGAADVVVRPLPSTAAADPIVTGAWLDSEGNPCLLLDPAGIAAAARESRAAWQEAATPERRQVLVVDDSLTTRMLEQSILESAGYGVDLATSAEEALVKASQRRYQLFLVDVEMPGMDGFEFVARTRADPSLREIPAILVTSRGAPADRRRGLEAGARAYIVKGEFDQGRLLETIRGLVG